MSTRQITGGGIFGLLHQAQSLAVALRHGAAEVVAHAAVEVRALVDGDIGHGRPLSVPLDHRVDKAMLAQELRALEIAGQLREPVVCSTTRRFTKPMSAFGSARMISACMANEAVTPPVVGSVSTAMYRSPARCGA